MGDVKRNHRHTPEMARRADSDSEETYRKILRAAEEEVALTEPRDAISLRKVAQRAELTLGTVQYYFANKALLLEACLNGYYERLSLEVSQLVMVPPSEMDSDAWIAHVVRMLWRFISRERPLFELRVQMVSKKGGLPAQRVPLADKLFQAGAEALAKRVDRPVERLRPGIQAGVAIMMRFLTMSESEKEMVLRGLDPEKDLETLCEEYIVDALTLLVFA